MAVANSRRAYMSRSIRLYFAPRTHKYDSIVRLNKISISWTRATRRRHRRRRRFIKSHIINVWWVPTVWWRTMETRRLDAIVWWWCGWSAFIVYWNEMGLASSRRANTHSEGGGVCAVLKLYYSWWGRGGARHLGDCVWRWFWHLWCCIRWLWWRIVPYTYINRKPIKCIEVCGIWVFF